MEDKDILTLLFARSEQAIAALAAKFGHRLQRLAANILPTAQDAEESVSDSLSDFGIDTMFNGVLTATRFMEAVSVVICNDQGETLQSCTASPTNRQLYTFDLQTFVTDRPEVLRGAIDLEALPTGAYQCKVICHLITGTDLTAREFAFSK